ncbi:ABC transporter ATP-binding protein [Bifidobacterium actinocoloniiforme DSM 22766]|uniref:ABC transporter ATP-binding protein n=1 Tax=Bifidobacterium actinocoloniiforme DSM 22766 TaxID=1437605 RepID=A0A086Z006_9BIFI|nr:nitrate/sulfonate/bicarbonate ABC transporter ATP-binding protein [Bifidobacterium actinocoloniiforme]AKV55126.1 ABC transporter ATP-binding protein [Bifidobacterium actinocoloniiforme DSM 22766]KFI39856.1 ABC transporter ATP-binding protein [Bifidobacterium actinocoloniiforme DSM 22766]
MEKITNIIEARHVNKEFESDQGNELKVLDDMSFTLHEGEVVAILGRSGAGKSTFLRILAGLIPASSGSVTYRGHELDGPNPGVALVFQSFALMPWLTVEANVELGLQARGVPRDTRKKLALAAIDSIGLDGFESAYPKELSGGMRQRVGIARALVLKPDALFMDEPFSALDVLTAENLRQEVLKVWSSESDSIKSVLMVTHNIEEAVQMADRVVVLGSHPGHIIAEVPITLPRPRDKQSDEFQTTVDYLYAVLTGRSDKGDIRRKLQSKVRDKEAINNSVREEEMGKKVLPDATPGGLAGLVDVMSEHPDGIDMADLAAKLNFEVDDLFPLIDAGLLLGIFDADNGHVSLTKLGRDWQHADILQAKEMFSSMILEHVPLVRVIDRALKNSESKTLHGSLILDLLRSHHSDKEAVQQFETAISWGRYGELFDYDADDDRLTLDPENKAPATVGEGDDRA